MGGLWPKIGVLVGKWGFGGFMEENGGFNGKMGGFSKNGVLGGLWMKMEVFMEK